MPRQLDDLVLAGLSKTGVTPADIGRVEQMCYAYLYQDELYNVRNEAKKRAVYTSGSYEEFKSVVGVLSNVIRVELILLFCVFAAEISSMRPTCVRWTSWTNGRRPPGVVCGTLVLVKLANI